MVKDAVRRASKFANKIDATVISSRISAVKDDMATYQNAAATEAVNTETLVKNVVEPLGVSSILVAQYINFGRQCQKMKNKFTNQTTGSTGTARVTELGISWKARGLTSATLEAVAAAFGWTITVP